MVESEKKIGRKSFLKRSAILAGGAITGVGGIKIFQNEKSNIFDDQKLIRKIEEIPQRSFGFQVGIHTFELNDYRAFSKNIYGPKTWGTFVSIEEMTSKKYKDYKIEEFVNLMHDEGATPHITIIIRDWVHNKRHPFAKQNRKLLYELIDETAEKLDVFEYPIDVRPWMEMNLPSFPFGRDRGMSSKEHEEAFREVFAYTYTSIKKARRYPTQIYFSPWVNTYPYQRFPFKGYYPGDNCDAVGFDGYNFYPGGLNIFSGNWWNGNLTPEEVFSKPFEEMLELTGGEKPTWVFETGTGIEDYHQWLGHAFLFALSHPECGGYIHFGIDKTKEEGMDFRLGERTLQTYGKWSKRFITSSSVVGSKFS